MLYMDQTYLGKIKDSDPEEFILLALDRAAGSMKHMSDPFSEEAFRKDMAEQGMPQAEIEAKIAHARANPV
jgi:hypothetical protein